MAERVLILSFPEWGEKLRRYLDDRLGVGLAEVLCLDRRLFDDEPFYDMLELERLYGQVCHYLESYAEQHSASALRHLTVLVTAQAYPPTVNGTAQALFPCDDWNPLLTYPPERRRPHPRTTLFAWLVLAYPEVRWVFLAEGNSDNLNCLHSFHWVGWAEDCGFDWNRKWPKVRTRSDETLGDYIPLFDPAGLRNEIRRAINRQSSLVPERAKVAAAIDEEEPYAYFNAYTAYRIGFRCHVVTTERMMRTIFSNRQVSGQSTGQSRSSDSNVELVFEDLYLNFPDGTFIGALSDLKRRDEEFNGLARVKHRILITVGHKRTIEPDRWRRNKVHLQELRNNGQHNKILYKPFSGVFDLWRASGLYRRLGKGKYKGLADGYRWPPEKAGVGEEVGGHSARGRLLEVAERLIARAEKVLSDATSVEDSTHGALLALEAQELLGNRTPTTALEALAIRQQLEVIAECMFYGTQSHLNVKERFQDIEREVHSISEWFRTSMRKPSELNAQIGILNQVILRFREYNQFDEEQSCLDRARRWERLLWLERHKSWAWLFYPFRAYVELLLSSIPRFLSVVALWVVALTLIFQYCPIKDPNNPVNPLTHGFTETVTTFFGVQPAHGIHNNLSWALFVSFVIVAGFVHLGILISHLYSMLVRR